MTSNADLQTKIIDIMQASVESSATKYVLINDGVQLIRSHGDILNGTKVMWTDLLAYDSDKPCHDVNAIWYKQPARSHHKNAFYLYGVNKLGERFYLGNSGTEDCIVTFCLNKYRIPIGFDSFIETDDHTIHYVDEPQFTIGMSRTLAVTDYLQQTKQEYCYLPSDCAQIPFKLTPVLFE